MHPALSASDRRGLDPLRIPAHIRHLIAPQFAQVVWAVAGSTPGAVAARQRPLPSVRRWPIPRAVFACVGHR